MPSNKNVKSCLSIKCTLYQTHHAVMLPTLLLFLRASLSLLASGDVSHREQGGMSAISCAVHLRLDKIRGTLRP